VGVTTSLRSLQGIAFAALLALALWMSALTAIADTRETFGGPNMFDPGFFDHPGFGPGGRHLGRLGVDRLFGVTWE
jgi:hypothetical protein